MFALGFERYSEFSASERRTVYEWIGAAGGGVVGFAAAKEAIEAAGIKGVSAAGISTGLAKLGRIVGGRMVAGVLVVAVIPLAAIGAGYGAVRGGKYLGSWVQLNSTDIDVRWEIKRPNGGPL